MQGFAACEHWRGAEACIGNKKLAIFGVFLVDAHSLLPKSVSDRACFSHNG
jgi:hypothetical protein